jgi:hypothetical protein
MKKEYRKSRYSGNIVNGVRFWLVMVVLVSSIGPISVSANVVWEDNFDDGNYDGWTVRNGTFSAANYYLESTELAQTQNVSRIYHESNVSTGTWSFDCYLPSEENEGIGLSLLTDADHISYLWVQINSERVVLWLNITSAVHGTWGWQMVAWWRSVYNGTWTHIDVTLDEIWLFNVFVNNVHRISYTNSTPVSSITDNRYFCFISNTIGQAIDNVVVSDTIDILGNGTTTTTTVDGVDMTMILLVGGGIAAVVVIVLVVWKFRGRT